MRALLFLLVCLFLVGACNAPALPAPATEEEQGPADPCHAVLPEANPSAHRFSTVVEAFNVVAPSGNRIYGLIRRPDPQQTAGMCFPAVVEIPGGINPGRMAIYGAEQTMLAEAGMVVVTFNAEGRVDSVAEDIASEGSEDFNGFRQQDGLCALVQYVMALDFVLPDNVGLRTQSFGITMGAGCAGRHPEIPIKYIVDGEGPPSGFVTCHDPYSLDDEASNDKHEIVFSILGHYSTWRDASPENEEFWLEREAIRFLPGFRGRYLRLQAEWDHAQPPANQAELQAFWLPPLWWQNKHAIDLVNAAVQGGVPWVRVNLPEQGNAVNAMYDIGHPPVFLPGKLEDGLWGVRAVLEMARME
jgi:hypothetical protein